MNLGMLYAEVQLSSGVLFCNSTSTKHIQEFKPLFLSIFSFVVTIITVKSERLCGKYSRFMISLRHLIKIQWNSK